MPDNNQERIERVQADDFRVEFLMRETGITEVQARDLIKMLGNNPSSLLREARWLAKE